MRACVSHPHLHTYTHAGLEYQRTFGHNLREGIMYLDALDFAKAALLSAVVT